MKKAIEKWSVRDLREKSSQINFPEYQREPNLWSLTEKQRLVDSMVRRFDIASLYFYDYGNGSIDCVDGRQRITSILSFVGDYQKDDDANFRFRHLNEIYQDSPPFKSLDGKTFVEIEKLAKESNSQDAKGFLRLFVDYELTVVMLSDSKQSEEFNLQFTRLNLGTIINSGEKLHAMVGDLRNECFGRLGEHPFLKKTKIPTRRFAREQVAAQIVAQVFSLSELGVYTRTRHFDLQGLFKRNNRLIQERKALANEIWELLNVLEKPFASVDVLRNRAITVSTVLLAWKQEISKHQEATDLAEFIDEFVHRLNWQTRKGLQADPEYYYLIEFQRNITQASAESSSVAARASVLEEELICWRQSKKLKGDSAWQEKHPNCDPSEES